MPRRLARELARSTGAATTGRIARIEAGLSQALNSATRAAAAEPLSGPAVETAFSGEVAMVSEAEAEAGEITATRQWSPYRIAKAVESLVDAEARFSVTHPLNVGFTMADPNPPSAARPDYWFNGDQVIDSFQHFGPSADGIMMFNHAGGNGTFDIVSAAFEVIGGVTYEVKVTAWATEGQFKFRVGMNTVSDTELPAGKEGISPATGASPSPDDLLVVPRDDPSVSNYQRDWPFEISPTPTAQTIYSFSWTAPALANLCSVSLRRTAYVGGAGGDAEFFFSEVAISEQRTWWIDPDGNIRTTLAVGDTSVLPSNMTYVIPLHDGDGNVLCNLIGIAP